MDKKINFINLTPHDINVYSRDGELLFTIHKCSYPPRLKEIRRKIAQLDNIDINFVTFELDGIEIPSIQNGTYYIVSRLLAESIGRADFLIPDETVRDKEGRIIGCMSFASIIDLF